MARRQEIVKATKECREDYVGLGRHLTSDDIADAFEEGAEWADKTMIEKACQYLKNALYEVASGVTHSFDIMSIQNTTMDDFISSFRKAMLEEE